MSMTSRYHGVNPLIQNQPLYRVSIESILVAEVLWTYPTNIGPFRGSASLPLRRPFARRFCAFQNRLFPAEPLRQNENACPRSFFEALLRRAILQRLAIRLQNSRVLLCCVARQKSNSPRRAKYRDEAGSYRQNSSEYLQIHNGISENFLSSDSFQGLWR